MDVDSVDYAGSLRIRKQRFIGVLKNVPSVTYDFGGGYLEITGKAVRALKPHSFFQTSYTPSFHYFFRDHRGSNRVVANGDGTIEQQNDYFAYGGPWGDTSTGQGFQPLKYTGKELDRVHGLDWYDYGARRYNPAIGLFTQADPFAEQYPYLNPYLYCAGNPVNFVDPTGMIIDPVSEEEWKKQRGLLQNKVLYLKNKIDKINEKAEQKEWSAEKTARKIGDKSDRMILLNNTLHTMDLMETDKNEVYYLNKVNNDQLIEGCVNRAGNQINITYNNTALFVHEITHAGQGLTGDLVFLPNGNTLYQDIYDEVNAYKAQFAYMNLPLFKVTPTMIQNIEVNGNKPYSPSGEFNIGVIPVNNKSDNDTFKRAYYWLYE